MRLKEWGDTKMEDVKDLLGRLLNRVDGSGISDEDLNRQINAIYSIYASAVGSEQIIVQASRFNALKYIHDENPRIRLIGMERLILESRDLLSRTEPHPGETGGQAGRNAGAPGGGKAARGKDR